MSGVHPSATIDPSSVVAEAANVGEGTRIWHFCHVMAGAHVGADCTIGQGCFIGGRAIVGRRVKLQNHVSVFDGVELEDEVFCGPGVVFTNVVNPRASVPRRSEYRHTLVEQGATIGANATILPGVAIGRFAFVGAGTVVSRDVRPFALVVGSPARQIGWMSRHGERLHFDANERAVCPATGEIYWLTLGGTEVREENRTKS